MNPFFCVNNNHQSTHPSTFKEKDDNKSDENDKADRTTINKEEQKASSPNAIKLFKNLMVILNSIAY